MTAAEIQFLAGNDQMVAGIVDCWQRQTQEYRNRLMSVADKLITGSQATPEQRFIAAMVKLGLQTTIAKSLEKKESES